MLKFQTDHYHNFKELTQFLKDAKKEYPDLCHLESIGKTSEGRDIWMLTVTNKKVSPVGEKPGFWIDANTHASEITGTQCALYFIHRVLTTYGKNHEVTQLLDHAEFYVVPRISADGAEYYLKTNFEVRSNTLPWPNPPVHENFIPQDLDGDGWILTIRKKDPAGAFKISDENENLMVQRKHHDAFGKKQDYYKLYIEGQFQNFDGFAENFEDINGFDLNRQYPAGYRPEGKQWGAGPHAMYLPEARAFVEAFTKRHRVYGHITLHTFGGLILRPPAGQPDENFDAHDMEIFKKFSIEGERISGYKALSVHKDFRYNPRDAISGSTDDWTFEHRGVFAFTIEIWDIYKEAGIEIKDHVGRYFYPSEEELLKAYAWCEKNLKKSDFYREWKPFDHPQLGPVEIGGWKFGYVFRNPPPKFLKQELEKVYDIILTQAKSLPIIRLKKVDLQPLGDATKVTVVFENEGYLPTNGSEQALKVAAVRKPTIRLETKLKIKQGKDHQEIHHLKGYSRFLPWHSPLWFYSRSNQNEVKLEWILEGKGKAEIVCDFARGGVQRHKLTI